MTHERTPSAPTPTRPVLPSRSLARHLVIRLMPPILLLVLLDLAATWVITHKIDMSLWMLEDFFWLMVVGQIALIALFTWVVVQGVRSGLRSVNHLSEEIRQRSIDDMQPLEVAGVPVEIEPLVTHTNDMLLRLDASLAAQRRFIGHAQHPLPCHHVNGKILCHAEELDEWVRGFPRGGNEVGRLVDEILGDQKRKRPRRRDP